MRIDKQIERINKYENILNNSKIVITNLEKALSEYAKIQTEIKELDTYYGSETWYKDVADYDMNLLPKDIKAGVLSEDAIYDLLTDNKDMAIKLLEIAPSILKNNQ